MEGTQSGPSRIWSLVCHWRLHLHLHHLLPRASPRVGGLENRGPLGLSPRVGMDATPARPITNPQTPAQLGWEAVWRCSWREGGREPMRSERPGGAWKAPIAGSSANQPALWSPLMSKASNQNCPELQRVPGGPYLAAQPLQCQPTRHFHCPTCQQGTSFLGGGLHPQWLQTSGIVSSA